MTIIERLNSCTTKIVQCVLRLKWEYAKGGNGTAENDVPEELIKKNFESEASLLVDFWVFPDIICIDACWGAYEGVWVPSRSALTLL